MFIKLQDGNKLDITEFSEYSVALTIKLEELPDMVSIFDGNNVSEATVNDKKIVDGKENSQDKPKVEIKPWDEKVTYNKGDLAIARGIVFVSKIDNNKGNEPGFGSAWDYKK